LEEAEKLIREALDVGWRIWGSEHPDTLRTMRQAGDILSRLGQHEEEHLLKML
jgi:hypothetical protein